MAFDSWRGQGDGGRVVVGGQLVAALAGPVVVEVVGVVAEDLLGMAAIEDQSPVGVLLADRAGDGGRGGVQMVVATGRSARMSGPVRHAG